jgi:hypothetical protein
MTNNYKKQNGFPKIRFGLIMLLLGYLIFLIGVEPDIFGLDRSPVMGFVQIAVFLVGLALICLGGYVCLMSLWNGMEKTIAAEIGFRLVCTGYVIAVISGMADVFGFGTHTFPNIPYFGPLQGVGVIIAESIIVVGFVLLIPLQQPNYKRDLDQEPLVDASH